MPAERLPAFDMARIGMEVGATGNLSHDGCNTEKKDMYGLSPKEEMGTTVITSQCATISYL